MSGKKSLMKSSPNIIGFQVGLVVTFKKIVMRKAFDNEKDNIEQEER